MRRWLALVIMVAVATSCATRSDRATTPPSIPTSLVPNSPNDVGTGRCSFAMGIGLGATVTDVVAAGPSSGVLEVNDLIVGFDGAPIRTSGDLVTAVQSRAPGDTITVDAVRDAQPATATVTLGSSAEGRTLLGVIVTTLEDQVEPEVVPETPLESPLVRAVKAAGGLWLLDPAGVDWSSLGVAAPAGAMMSLNGEVYTVEVRAASVSTLIDAVSGQTIDVDLVEWDPVSVIGTLGNLLMIGAQRTDADGTVLDHAVIAVDPEVATPKWAWITDPASASPVPVIGHRSLDGSRVLVGLGTEDSAVPALWVMLSEQEGQPVASVATGIPNDAAVLGWYDAARVIAIVGTISEIALIDPDTGTSVRTTMPVSGEPTGLWPVGDGAHLLVEDGLGLVLATVGGTERRELTASCGETVVTDLGWNPG